MMRYGFPADKHYIGFGEILTMEGKFLESPASRHVVDDIIRLRHKEKGPWPLLIYNKNYTILNINSLFVN
jgi:hypothetical protein